MNTFQKPTLIGIAGLLGSILALSGCAVFKKHHNDTSTPDASASPAPLVPITVLTTPQQGLPGIVKTLEVLDPQGVERKDLEDYDNVSVHMTYADVVLTANQPGRKGKLSIRKLKGDTSCKAFVHETENSIQISDVASYPALPGLAGTATSSVNIKPAKSAVPNTPNCQFSVELSLHEAANLAIEVRRGSVYVEGWDEPIDIKMGWGDIDVGTVRQLDVACVRCTLSGENVAGPLRYSLETGNVGLSGLDGSVNGQTFGDTVLKWRKLNSNSQINLMSHAGDVLLFFPSFSPINADLKAPRGEVRNGKEGEVKVQYRTGAGGIPVVVTAEAGDVRLYRDSKSNGK